MQYIPYTNQNMKSIPQFRNLPTYRQHQLEVLSHVFPFKSNNYVTDELIDWNNFENDSLFMLNFPRKEMLEEFSFNLLSQLIKKKADSKTITNYAEQIKIQLLPGPSPSFDLIKLDNPEGITGIYRQFPQTLSTFTSGAQQCFGYCNYCFRWMSFAFDRINFNYSDPQTPVHYLKNHPEISDILFTGGDAFHMSASELRNFISPLLEIDSIKTIRFGTRVLTWWPYRFITDQDSDELLSVLDSIISRGKHVAFMAHMSHPQELSTDIVQKAIRTIRSTGSVIRCQGPVVKGVNDSKEVWIELINREIQLGLIPYYMFVESGKLPGGSFKIPLASVLKIFQDSQKELSGLAKTLQGPVLTNGPYKILIDGVTELNGEKVFVLKILQSGNPFHKGKIFFVNYNESETDINRLPPVIETTGVLPCSEN